MNFCVQVCGKQPPACRCKLQQTAHRKLPVGSYLLQDNFLYSFSYAHNSVQVGTWLRVVANILQRASQNGSIVDPDVKLSCLLEIPGMFYYHLLNGDGRGIWWLLLSCWGKQCWWLRWPMMLRSSFHWNITAWILVGVQNNVYPGWWALHPIALRS